MATLMLADKNEAWFLLATAPTNYKAPAIGDFSGAKNISDQVFDDGSYIRPSGSTSTKEPYINGEQNEAFGADNFEAQMSVALFADTDSDIWTALKEKGATAWIATRSLQAWGTKPAIDDLVSVYQVMADTPQPPQNRNGYQKRTIPLAVQKAVTDVKIVADTTTGGN